jgi:hypothetical protein
MLCSSDIVTPRGAFETTSGDAVSQPAGSKRSFGKDPLCMLDTTVGRGVPKRYPEEADCCQLMSQQDPGMGA